MSYFRSFICLPIAIPFFLGMTACGGGGDSSGEGGVIGTADIPTQISWVAPTTYNDNTTPLNDLANYRFYYGPNSNSLQLIPELDLNDPNATSLTINNLTSQDIDVLINLVKNNSTHWFAMTAVNSQGTESVLSTPVQYIP